MTKLFLSSIIEFIRQLNLYYKNPTFRKFREMTYAATNQWIALSAAFFWIFFYIFDIVMGNADNLSLVYTRILSCIYFVILLYIIENYPKARYKNQVFTHLIFYGASISMGLLTSFGGGFESTYWCGMMFIFIPFFVLIPFSYKEKLLHSILMIGVQSAVIYFSSLKIFILKNFLLFQFYQFSFLSVFLIFSIFYDYHYIRAYQMARELEQEKKISDRLLLNILPKTIAARLKSGEKIISSDHPKVAVLFADLVGFTSLSQEIDSRTLVKLLDEIFSEFDQMGNFHGMEKIKTIGDAYMAICGAPDVNAKPEDTSLNFAKEILSFIDSYNLKVQSQIAIRIGIHSGPVVAGVIGFVKYSYDLWGETVNFASRLETTSPINSIHVSHEFYHALSNQTGFSLRKGTKLKGLGEKDTYSFSSNHKISD
jgi:class 3 adenylate cyclase